MDERLLTVFDCARLAANSPAFWRKMIDEGRIAVVRIGRSVRIRRQDFEAFLEAGMCPAVYAYRSPDNEEKDPRMTPQKVAH